jgi:hypothetical protein
VNTLFSCLVGVGHKFSGDQWKVCLNETIFGVLSKAISKGKNKNEDVLTNIPSTEFGDKTSNRYRVALHHSRDSAIKQWATTQVLILRGLERVLRHFFDQFLAATVGNDDDNDKGKSWFELGWLHILEQSYQCSINVGGRDTLAVRLAGVDLLVVCLQLSSYDGIVAAKNPARVGTNMQVVNGALRSVRTSNQTMTTPQRKIEKKAENFFQMNRKRHQLFLNAFEILVRYQTYLNDESMIELENLLDQPTFVETPLLQVLTRLGNGFSKLYECCKNNEMAPAKPLQNNISIKRKDEVGFNVEAQMVDLIVVVMKRALVVGEGGSRFLTQGQRICLELLQKMASNSSSMALESLAETGGSAFFSSDSSSDEEKLEFEIAKAVSQIYGKEELLHRSKVTVLDMILGRLISYHAVEQNNVDKKKQKMNFEIEDNGDIQEEAAFEIMVNIFQGGLQAADSIDKDFTKYDYQDKNDANLLLENVWTKSISFLRIVVESHEYNSGYLHIQRTKSIMKLLSISSRFFPERIYDKLGTLYSFGVTHTSCLLRSTKFPNFLEESKKEITCRQRVNLLSVFESCFQGLCKCMPGSKLLQSCTGNLLVSVVEDIHSHLDHEPGIYFNANEKIAISICKTITEGKNLEDLAVRIFPYLSKLVNVANKDLRSEISAVLTKINMEDMLKRMEAAEFCSKEAKKINDILSLENDNLMSKLEQMDEITVRAKNSEILNMQLMKEVERLKSKNEELERQVAIFSEGSAYT